MRAARSRLAATLQRANATARALPKALTDGHFDKLAVLRDAVARDYAAVAYIDLDTVVNARAAPDGSGQRQWPPSIFETIQVRHILLLLFVKKKTTTTYKKQTNKQTKPSRLDCGLFVWIWLFNFELGILFDYFRLFLFFFNSSKILCFFPIFLLQLLLLLLKKHYLGFF